MTNFDYSLTQGTDHPKNRLPNGLGLRYKGDMPPVDPEKFGQRIRQIRKEAGHANTKDASEDPSFPGTQGTLNRWEKGEMPGSIRQLAELAAYQGWSMDYLAGVTDDPLGLPLGHVAVDMRVVDEIMRAEEWDQVAHHVRILPDGDYEFNFGHKVDGSTRVLDALKWGRLIFECEQHIRKLLEGRAKQGG